MESSFQKNKRGRETRGCESRGECAGERPCTRHVSVGLVCARPAWWAVQMRGATGVCVCVAV